MNFSFTNNGLSESRLLHFAFLNNNPEVVNADEQTDKKLKEAQLNPEKKNAAEKDPNFDKGNEKLVADRIEKAEQNARDQQKKIDDVGPKTNELAQRAAAPAEQLDVKATAAAAHHNKEADEAANTMAKVFTADLAPESKTKTQERMKTPEPVKVATVDTAKKPVQSQQEVQPTHPIEGDAKAATVAENATKAEDAQKKDEQPRGPEAMNV